MNKLPSIDRAAGLPGVYDISREQVSLGNRVFIICRHFKGQKLFEEVDGMLIRRVGTPFNLNALREIGRLKKKYYFKIVHSHATACFYFPLYRYLLDRSGLRHVVHVHGTTKGILNSWKILGGAEDKSSRRHLSDTLATVRERFLWRNSDAIIAVSDSVKLELLDLYGVDERKIFVINNGVDLQRFRKLGESATLLQKLGFKPDTELVLYLGWFRAIKGPDVLFRALDIIRRRQPLVKALIVSGKVNRTTNNYYKELMELIRRLDLEEIIQIKETIPHNNLPEVYNAARVVVVPSIHDSFPKVALEAMACGTPVVASNVGGLSDILAHHSGILVKPQDPVELAEAVIRIISNQDLAKEISEIARQRAVENFSWKKTAAQIMHVYQKTLSFTVPHQINLD